MPKKVLETTFKADGDLLQYMQRSGAGADQLKAKMAELRAATAKKGGGGGEDGEEAGGLKSVRQQLGARSGLGQLGSILTGGAAVGGVTLLAGAIGNAADKATVLAKQFEAGKINAGQMAGSLAESIPVLGQMVTAFDKVEKLGASLHLANNKTFGVLTSMLGPLGALIRYEQGEREYAEQVRQSEAARVPVLGYQADALERQKKLYVDLAEATRRNQQEAAGANLDGYEKERYERQAGNENKLADIQAKRRAALEDAEKDRKAKFAEISASDAGTGVKVEMQTRLQRQAREEAARINREFDGQAKEQQATADVEGSAALRRHLDAQARVYAGYTRAIAETTGAADVARLQAQGRTLDAELLGVQQNAAEKKRAIDEALAEQVKQASNPAERSMLTADADAAKAAVDRAAAMDRQNAVYKELRDAQVQSLTAQAAAGDRAAAAELRRVQAAREYEAEAAKITGVLNAQGASVADRAAAEKSLADLNAARSAGVADRLRLAELDILRERAAAGDAGAAQDVDRLERAEKVRTLEADIVSIRDHGTPEQATAAERELAALKAAGALTEAKAARDQHDALLQQKAEYGATAADRLSATRELAAEQIKQQFAQRAAAAQAIADDKDATAEQKKQAAADLAEFAELAGREYAKKVFVQPKPVLHEFNAEDRGLLLSGVGAAARNQERNPTLDVARNTAEGNKMTASLLASVQGVAGAVRDGRPGQPAAVTVSPPGVTLTPPAAPAVTLAVPPAPAPALAARTPPPVVNVPRPAVVLVPPPARPPHADAVQHRPPPLPPRPAGRADAGHGGEYRAVLGEIRALLGSMALSLGRHAGGPPQSVFPLVR